MIQATELRIGNIINEIGIDYDAGGNKFVDRSSIDIIKVLPETIRIIAMGGPDAELYEPIPLTPEILEKCGFIKVLMHDGFYDYVKNGINISMPYFEYHFNDGDSNTTLATLHQLQNLYFALTGEELTVIL